MERTISQGINVRDLVWHDQDAYRSLWGWLKRHDLVGEVTWRSAPMDDPARYLFTEPRMLHTQDNEGIWLRVVDAPQALAQRGYGTTSGSISIELPEDTLTPWNAGVVTLDVDSGAASVDHAASGAADLRMPVKTLALLYTGFASARELASAGLLAGDTAAVETADRLFAGPEPWVVEMF